MKIKVSEISEHLLDFVDSSPENVLETDYIILTNEKWNLYLDYQGENPRKGLETIRLLANHKTKLMKNFVASESPGQILQTARDFSDFLYYRNFSVSIAAKNNVFLGLLLRARVFLERFF